MLNNANRHGRLNLASVQACINARSEDFIDAAKSKGAIIQTSNGMRPGDAVKLLTWARYWNLWGSVNILKGFFEATQQAAFLPKTRDELGVLLDVFLLEKAAYELGYELNSRPDWVNVPIAGILETLKSSGRY